MQNITIAGTIDSNAKVVQKREGGEFLNFFVAVTDGKGGYTSWYSCIVNNNYQNIAPYLLEGAKVVVQGRLIAKAYTDDQGEARPSLTVVTSIGGIEILQFNNNKTSNRGRQQSEPRLFATINQ